MSFSKVPTMTLRGGTKLLLFTRHDILSSSHLSRTRALSRKSRLLGIFANILRIAAVHQIGRDDASSDVSCPSGSTCSICIAGVDDFPNTTRGVGSSGITRTFGTAGVGNISSLSSFFSCVGTTLLMVAGVDNASHCSIVSSTVACL